MDALFVNLITVANTEEVHTITELLLKSTPVVKAADAFGIADPSASRAMACEYSNPQPFCAQGKPLRKVILRRVAVL